MVERRPRAGAVMASSGGAARLSWLGCASAEAWATSLDEEAATQLALLLEFLQSSDVFVEAVADSVAGAAGWWSAVSALELWKALCRLRLLALQPAGMLMRSLVSEEDEREEERARNERKNRRQPKYSAEAPPPWASMAMYRLNRWSPARPLEAPAVGPGRFSLVTQRPSIVDGLADGVEGFICRLADFFSSSLAASLRVGFSNGGARLMALGEALHIAQPVFHLMFRLATLRRRAGIGQKMRMILPFRRLAEEKAWLCAFAIEVFAYGLCRRAATLIARKDRAARCSTRKSMATQGGSESPFRYNGVCTRRGETLTSTSLSRNEEELNHRRKLLVLLIVRPLVLGVVRGGIGMLASQGRDPGIGSSRNEWSSSANAIGQSSRRAMVVTLMQRTLELIDSIDAVQPRYSGSGGWG